MVIDVVTDIDALAPLAVTSGGHARRGSVAVTEPRTLA